VKSESWSNEFRQETLWKLIDEKGGYNGRMEFSYLPNGGAMTRKSSIDENEGLVYQKKYTFQENGLMSSDSYQGGGFIEVWNYQYGYDSLGIWVYKGYYQEGVLLFYSERDVEYW
jgi:hypothetical protein